MNLTEREKELYFMEVITGTIGYGVVGSGYFGAELARIMNTKQGAQIRAVYDPENGGPVAAELGCMQRTAWNHWYPERIYRR